LLGGDALSLRNRSFNQIHLTEGGFDLFSTMIGILQANPLPPDVQDIGHAGGLAPFVKIQLNDLKLE